LSGTTLAKLYSSDAKFQFPYCAWEFNIKNKNLSFMSSMFQFPYCAWEFNSSITTAVPYISLVSIPILRVGVQRVVFFGDFTKVVGFNSHTARGSSTRINTCDA